MKVLVVGYFYKNNLGDDVFEYIWRDILGKIPGITEAEFKSIQATKDIEKDNNIDTVIFAGGNLFNNYFADRISSFLNDFKGQVIGYSVAIPYNGFCVTSDLPSRFDYINCRSKKDTHMLNMLNMLQKIYDKDISDIDYSPDISVYLPDILPKVDSDPFNLFNNTSFLKRVGIFLTRPIYQSKHYNKIVQVLAESIDEIASTDEFEIYLIPFDTNDKCEINNDMLFNNDIYKLVKSKRVTNVHRRFSVSEMFTVFKNLDISVNMRFHSIMYAIMADIPFVPLFTTKKIKQLLQDLEYPYSYKLPVDYNDLPVNIDKNLLLSTFFNVWNNQKECKRVISKYKSSVKLSYTDFVNSVRKRIMQKNGVEKVVGNSIQFIITKVVEYINTQFGIVVDSDICNDICHKIYNKKQTFHDIMPTATRKQSIEIAQLICFLLLKDPSPIYMYGLADKVFSPTFTVHEDLEWVWNDWNENNNHIPKRCNSPKFNMVNVSSSEIVHRSGWKYVVENLIKEFHSDGHFLIFDNYIDKTFHWNNTIYKYCNIIPYTTSWCGFLHHTFDTSFSEYNLEEMFKNEMFLKSLDSCVALFTLSSYLANLVKDKLKSINVKINVYNFIHPTEAAQEFNIETFCENPNKKIVNIGGWLRNSYTIYQLQPASKYVSQDHISIQKCRLQGNSMDSYVKPHDFCIKDENESNKYISGLLQHIKDQDDSVVLINTLSDLNYDLLLSENIVFIDLVDASAVNTVIEYIVRNTPILVNPLPSIVELLGEDYPFYYRDISEANYKASHLPTIKETHIFLAGIDKKPYTIEYFIKSMKKTF